LLEQENLLLIA